MHEHPESVAKEESAQPRQPSKTPVAVFAYKRPAHLRDLLQSLVQCTRLEECQIHIFFDGCRDGSDRAAVDAARKVVGEFQQSLTPVCVYREHNLGLARSIATGVTAICRDFARVIVLEDDLLVHRNFLNFMLQALDQYSSDERVAQVAGYLPPIHVCTSEDALFLPVTTSLGWATWARAWSWFSKDSEEPLKALSSDPRLRNQFNLDGAYDYYWMLQRHSSGLVDSWAVHWYWSAFSRNALTLYPAHSLVWVGGFDDSATHTRSAVRSRLYDQARETVLDRQWSGAVTFPTSVQVDPVAFTAFKRILKPSMGERALAFLRRALALLRRR